MVDIHRGKFRAVDDQLGRSRAGSARWPRRWPAVADQLAELAAGEDGLARHTSWFEMDDPARGVPAARRICMTWLDQVYLQFPDAALPTCWLWHPSVVEELLWLRRAQALRGGAAERLPPGRGARRAGLPAGVFNLVTGHGPVVGEAIAAHPDVDMVSFTGSTAAGRQAGRRGWRPQTVKRVALELGGKSANVILDDADLRDGRAPTAWPSATSTPARPARALTRMLVPARTPGRGRADRRGGGRRLQPGDPFDRATTLGPLVSDAQRERVRGYIRKGDRRGRQARHRRRRRARGPGHAATSCRPRCSPTSRPT